MRNGGNLRGLYVSGWWLLYEKPEYHVFGKASPLSTDNEAMKPIVDPTTVVNISPETQSHFPMPDKVVITYFDRQNLNGHNRNFIESDNEGLIEAMRELVDRKN
jgi:hypothetical protein